MKFTNKNVIKSYRRNFITLIVGCVFIALMGLFIFLSIKQNDKENDNILYLNDIIESENEKEGQKAYLNINAISSAFAVYDNKTDAYYYASDGEYYYIIYLTKEKYKELSNIDLSNSPVRVEGIARDIDSELKQIAIDEWNLDLEDDEEKVTSYNFYDYFGNIYLDQTTSYSETESMYYVFIIISGIMGLFMVLIGSIGIRRYMKSIKKLDDSQIQMLESEMSDSDSFYAGGIYFTRNYIIMLNGKFEFYRYDDILWMYPYELRQNGIRTSKSIRVLTNSGKIYTIANISIATKKQKNIYDQVWNIIIHKNANVRLGYTDENVKYYRDIVKQIKNK